MSAGVRARALLTLAVLAVTVVALPAVMSGATMNSTSTNPGNAIVADSPLNYLRMWSQSTDPFVTTGYAIRQGTTSTPAATGSGLGLTVHLGGNRNVTSRVFNRVLTVDSVNPLPAGASPITIGISLQPDPTTGLQPIVGWTLRTVAAGGGGAASATIAAGVRRQLNLTITTNGLPTNVNYVPTVTITVTYAGYAGGFLNYVVPIRISNANGAGT
jgi:hypothetical protein